MYNAKWCNALNDPLASFVFIYCIIVWKCMLKCVLRVQIKIYIYIYIYTYIIYIKRLKYEIIVVHNGKHCNRIRQATRLLI